MKRMYNNPEIKVSRFATENILTASGIVNEAQNGLTSGSVTLDSKDSSGLTNVITADNWQ